MRRLILGTAGHIDHGKTALVRALTGTDTDRLPEEKRRGITIDLGFAELPLGSGRALSIVDVPGHEAFIRNMVAGASGIDMVLFVVAADEGVMPQTREHLAIVELLGVTRGVVALTKADLVEEDWLELVRDEVRQLLGPTPLRAADIVSVSARTGAGLEELTRALGDCADGMDDVTDDDLFRMPVDRVFTVRGTGTVVTGTVWSGSIARDAQVRLLPAGVSARVRTLQQHGVECDVATAGTRAAIALTGVERDALSRGDTVLAGTAWDAGSILTVDLQVVRDAAPIRPRQRVRVHIGTAEVLARVGMASSPLEPGTQRPVQLRLESPVVARAGDRLVVRSYSPVHTIGGGLVLEPRAPKRRRLTDDLAAALASLRSALTAAGGIDVEAALPQIIRLAGAEGAARAALPVTTGAAPAAIDGALRALRAGGAVAVVGERVIAGARLDAARTRLLDAVGSFHERHPAADGMPRNAARQVLPAADAWLFDAAVDGLLASRTLMAVGNALAVPGFAVRLSPAAAAALATLKNLFEDAGLAPPDLQELPPHLRERSDLSALLRTLEREGSLLRLSADRWISAAAVRECARALQVQFGAGQPVAMADFKESLKLTRKHLIPLLEHFDRTGVTRREGDSRVLL